MWDKKRKTSRQETIKYLGEISAVTRDDIPEEYREDTKINSFLLQNASKDRKKHEQLIEQLINQLVNLPPDHRHTEGSQIGTTFPPQRIQQTPLFGLLLSYPGLHTPKEREHEPHWTPCYFASWRSLDARLSGCLQRVPPTGASKGNPIPKGKPNRCPNGNNKQ